MIPPDATLTITGGVLGVQSPPGEPRGHRTPIDHFFRSLAEDQGEFAVCIMLSGTGTDGTLGLQAVKEYGGMALAQTPASAQYDGILRSAIAGAGGSYPGGRGHAGQAHRVRHAPDRAPRPTWP